MALTERRIRYETLIRWHEDGSIGAHQVDLDQMLRDGVVISSTLTTIMPLGTADYPGVTPLSDILSEAAAAALARVGVLEQALGEVNSLAQQQSDQLTQVRGELGAVQTDLAVARQTIADLQVLLAEAHDLEEAPAETVAESAPV
jgi:flagellin-like hook-associated protein FlgL